LSPSASTTNTMATSLTPQAIWRIGSTFGFTAVTLGAFGAHGLQKRYPDLPARSIKNWETASSYLLIHGVVLLGLRFVFLLDLRYEDVE
jgi:uncharacterized membrane protein YgdD (TMEM256/DUF423 family)